MVCATKRGEQKFRLCVDFRESNAQTIPERMPLPKIDEVLDHLGGNTYFSCLSNVQILMRESDIEKTAFITHEGSRLAGGIGTAIR